MDALVTRSPRLAAFWPFTPTAIDDVATWSELVTGGAFERLWLGQSVALETASTVAYAAGTGRRVPIGIAVNVIPMHHPLTVVQSMRAMAAATGHDVRVCFSAGDPVAQERFTGARYSSPMTAAREFLTVVRGLLDGERVRHDGTYFPLDAALPARPHAGRVLIGLGVLRPGMTRLAGELADTATSWLTPPDYVRDVLVPALDEGAAVASRPRPELVVPVHCVLAGPGRDPVALAEVAIGKHLRTPSYRKLLAAAGEDDVLARGHRAALDSGLVTYGTADDIAERVLAVAAAGADEVPLVVHHPHRSWPAARDEWLEVGSAVAARLSSARRDRPTVATT
ncbi:LLM class flavin-dependent oxidoreductase [Nocardioides sp. C4-1]|uniref:LLM class flavin-dependent oxidoreductase n=1 Tax=Nocardioides sp. C4-1 TaxID=3151851 RepID=UPI003264506D